MSKNNRARRKEKLRARQERSKRLNRGCVPDSYLGPPSLGDYVAVPLGRSKDAIATRAEQARHAPVDIDLLAKLMQSHQEKGEAGLACTVAERIVEQHPHDPAWRLALAEAYLAAGAPHAGCAQARAAHEKWSTNPLVENFQAFAQKLELASRQVTDRYGFAGRDVVEEMALYDRVVIYASVHEIARALEVAKEFVHRLPTFIPGWNYLGTAYFMAGRTPEALELMQHSLQLAPENTHALSNLVQFCFLAGKLEDARRWFDQLQRSECSEPDHWLKKAEAAAWLGEDAFVSEACRAAEANQQSWSPYHRALLHHLAAVAHYRQGRQAEARKSWKKSLAANADSPLATDNLASWKERAKDFSPWYFSTEDWIPDDRFHHLCETISRALVRGGKSLSGLAASYPELRTLIPGWLDRGDSIGRGLAVAIAIGSQDSVYHDALLTFVRSQRGSDEYRMKAAEYLTQEGVLPAGRPLRLFVDGKWSQVVICTWDITDKPNVPPSRIDEVEELAARSYGYLERGDWGRAEPLLRRAVELEPQAPDLWNNLAEALEHSDQTEEADEILRHLRERFPDYFFGMIREANHATGAGDLDRAEELFDRLSQETELHVSEFRSLVTGQIKLLATRKDWMGARAWLNMWREQEEHPLQNTIGRGIERSRLMAEPRNFLEAVKALRKLLS